MTNDYDEYNDWEHLDLQKQILKYGSISEIILLNLPLDEFEVQLKQKFLNEENHDE